MTIIPIAVLILILLSGIRIAQEYERGVVFRLGRYVALRGPGIYWIIPLGIERAVTIDIRTRTVSAEQQETITRDSVTIKVNAVLWYRVVDSAKSVIAVRDSGAAVYQLAPGRACAISSANTISTKCFSSGTKSTACSSNRSLDRPRLGASRLNALK